MSDSGYSSEDLSRGSSPVPEQIYGQNMESSITETFDPCPLGTTNFWTKYEESQSCENMGYQKHRNLCYWKGKLVHSHEVN